MKKIMMSTLLATASVALLAGCGQKTETNNAEINVNNKTAQPAPTSDVAKAGDTVKVDYVGTLDDGSLFDTSIAEKAKAANKFDEQRPYEALVVNLGKHEVIPGFEKALEGMKVGETKKITLSADEAYGQPRTELVQNVPADAFSGSDMKPEVGKTYNFGIAQGTIKSMSDSGYVIDFNHPLAGKALTFELTLKEILPPSAAVIAEPTVPAELPTQENNEGTPEDVATSGVVASGSSN